MLLAVDTSTQWMGLALYDEASILGEMVWRTHSHHTVELSPSISELLKRCGVTPHELKALGVALGPGSFTSLRIGLAVVKGLCMALHIPVVGVPTLDVLAAAQPVQDLPMAAVLHAGRGRLAVGWYAAVDGVWQLQEGPQVMTVEELAGQIRKPTLVCGELDKASRQLLGRKYRNVVLVSPAGALRRPAYLAELAWKRWRAGNTDDVASLSPIYLHVVESSLG